MQWCTTAASELDYPASSGSYRMPAVSVSLFEASFKPPSRRLKQKSSTAIPFLGSSTELLEPRWPRPRIKFDQQRQNSSPACSSSSHLPFFLSHWSNELFTMRLVSKIAAFIPPVLIIISFIFTVLSTTSKQWAYQNFYSEGEVVALDQQMKPLWTIYRSPFWTCGRPADPQRITPFSFYLSSPSGPIPTPFLL